MMDFFKCLIVVIFCKCVVAGTKKSSLKNKQKTVCLTKTKLTIFIDFYQVDIISHFRDSIADYCRYLKIIFRRNPCLTTTLYDPIMRKFIQINERNLETTLDSTLDPTTASNKRVRPLIIDMDVIENFVLETKPTCLGSNHTTKQTVLYISNFFTNNYEPLRELSDIGGNCAVLMVAFFWNFELGLDIDNNLNFFDWLPFHRLISYTMSTFPSKIKELLPSQIELFKLITNPDFNRFEYYEKTLVPDFQFSDSLRTNARKWLFVRINWFDFRIFFNLDPILQLLNIFRKKLEGMSFQYSVSLPEGGYIRSKTVKKIIKDNLQIPMYLTWSSMRFQNNRFTRSLALTITRRDSHRLYLQPKNEINVIFNDICHGTLDDVCNTDFLREDNVRTILQSIDSYFVEEERKMKGIPGNS